MLTQDELSKTWNDFWKNEGFRKKRKNFFLDNSFAFLEIKLRRSAYSPLCWPQCEFSVKGLYAAGEWDEKKHAPLRSSDGYHYLNLYFEELVTEESEKRSTYLFPSDDLYQESDVECFFSLIKDKIIPELRSAIDSAEDFVAFIRKFCLENHCSLVLRKWVDTSPGKT